MARLLADLLNAEAAGDPLPAMGQQHTPIRFQIFHQTPPSAGAGVMYVHGAGARVVAYVERDEVARHVGRLLNHVDYPMREHGMWFPPTVGEVGFGSEELPRASVDQRAMRAPPQHRSRAVLVALSSLVPLVAVIVLAALAIGWQLIAALVCVWIVMMLIVGWVVARH